MTTDEGTLWVIKAERGFDRKPNDRDYETYFKRIMVCANGEGKLAEEERTWVVGFCTAFGGSDELVEELRTYKADEDVLDILARRTPVSEGCRRRGQLGSDLGIRGDPCRLRRR